MKKNREYLTTGEFAKLFGVKKQTMFHYDQMGIFCPEIVGDNGYRYYSYDQMEAFSIILMLREMGLSVADIRTQTDKHSPEDLVKLLKSKSLDIDAMIEHLKWSKEYIERKIKTTEEGIALRDGEGKLKLREILTVDLPDETMVMTRYKGPGDERTIDEAIGDHFRSLKGLGMSSCYPDGATIPRDSVKRTDEGVEFRYDEFYTVLTETEAKVLSSEGHGEGEAVFDCGGKFLAVYDDEGYRNVGECLLLLLEYAETHGLELGDKFYEDVIWDDLSTEGHEDYLVRFCIQVL